MTQSFSRGMRGNLKQPSPQLRKLELGTEKSVDSKLKLTGLCRKGVRNRLHNTSRQYLSSKRRDIHSPDQGSTWTNERLEALAAVPRLTSKEQLYRGSWNIKKAAALKQQTLPVH